MGAVVLKDFSWERMIAAAEAVRERACRAAGALNQAGIPHFVVGDHAVAFWVARVDKEAVRNTKDVDLLVRRDDFPRIVDVLQSIGFIHQDVSGVDLFLDGPEGSVRSAVHIVFAGEKVRPDYPLPTPDVAEAEPGPDFPVPTLDALVRMKLTSFRLKDKVHLMDMLDVGLIDESWAGRFPPEISARLGSSSKSESGKHDDDVPDPSPLRRPPPDGQGRAGRDRRRIRLAAGHQPRNGEPERPHDRPASGPRGLSPGEFVAGEVDGPRRPVVIGPSPEHLDESGRVVEVGLRPPRRRAVGVPFEEPAEPVAQGPRGDRDDPAHLVAPLAPERAGELLDLPSRYDGQVPGLLGPEPQLDAHRRRVGEEPIPQRRIDV